MSLEELIKATGHLNAGLGTKAAHSSPWRSSEYIPYHPTVVANQSNNSLEGRIEPRGVIRVKM